MQGTHRPPELPSGTLTVQPPPLVPAGEGVAGLLLNAIPLLGSVGAIVLVTSLARGDDAVLGWTAAGLVLLAALGFLAVQAHRQRARRLDRVRGSRSDYRHHLHRVRAAAREAAEQQRRALLWRHPAPTALPALAAERTRIWERDVRHPDLLRVRYGTSTQALGLRLVEPARVPGEQVDAASEAALRRLLAVREQVRELPAVVDLASSERIEVDGPEEAARSLARAIVCHAAAFHSPDQLVVAVLATPANLHHWDWLKWLPHVQSGRASDAVGPRRMVTTSLPALSELLPSDLGDRPGSGTDEPSRFPHVLLVADGAELPPGNHLVPADGPAGLTVLDLCDRTASHGVPPEDATRLRLLLDAGPADDGRRPLREVRVGEEPSTGYADQCDLATAEAFARRLLPMHTVPAETAESPTDLSGPADYLELLGLGSVHSYGPDQAWGSRPARDRLRVPIGLGDRGGPVHLDLKESAQQGMGPHGLVIGATGSGKSEFLRTLVLGLTLTHSPEQLNLVLVDFKGGATFAGMAEMPHVSAVITNLAEELTLVDRMQDALSGEMVRRQELLRAAGNRASVRDYERARTAGPDAGLEPMPSLLIVVDEFSELLSAKPELLDLFVAIGRLGRSLGLHLLLASQRLEEGRLRGLESHLSYRVGLRTFSAAESRAVLGVPDAYELPSVPGLGFLKPDPTSLVRFKAAYVSAPPSDAVTVRRDEGGHIQGILPFTVAEVRPLGVSEPETGSPRPDPVRPEDEQATVLDVAVRRMAGHGPAAHRVWLPPLEVPDTLDELMPDLADDPDLGLVSRGWRDLDGLVVPLGTLDRPREQRRDTMTVDLSGDAGHVAVVGGPRSGKSTLLRTVVTALALTTTPVESQLFVLDFGGGAFAPLARLPHVSGIGTRGEPDVVRRVVAEVRGVVDRREAYFRDQGIDSIETYRSRRARGSADDGWGDLFLVVDGWATLRSDFDDLELEIQQLAARGLTFGLHLVVGAARWADFRAAMRDVVGTRLELRLGDPLDSEIDRKAAPLVPTGRPGRGLAPGGLHFLGALPRIDGDAGGDTVGEGVDDLVGRVADAWRGPRGPKLRLLPGLVHLDDVREQAAATAPEDRRLLLGVDERELAPVGLDPDTEPHLVVFGDSGSGRSALLRGLAREVMRTRTPQEAQVIVVDHRRALLGEVPDEYRLDYLTSAARTGPAMHDLAEYLTNRLPGPDVTPEQLRNRSWWTGAEAYVLVDDYDLVATTTGSPLAPLVPLLSQARDVGLHVVVARRSGGASRALYDPLLQGLRDLGMPGVLLSGDREEGPLVGGVRPSPQPPGRGTLVTRARGAERVQLAWTDPAT